MGALLILLPLLTVLLLNLLPARWADRAALWVAGSLGLAQGLAVLFATPLLSEPLSVGPFSIAARGQDALSLTMLLSIGLVVLTTVAVVPLALPAAPSRYRLANLLLLVTAGMNGVVLTRDLFGLYVFLEVTAVSSFVLIALERGKAALEGAFKYLVLSAVATTLILAGLALLFMTAGGTGFEQLAQALKQAQQSGLTQVATALLLVGLAIKAGLVPFHGWLPDAYQSAPAPVSVLLAGVVTKASGVYTLMRLTEAVFGFGPLVRGTLLWLGALSILVGALAALGQKDFKRMLAFSSISQVGYIILGLGAGSALGMAGAIFHLFNHSIFKSLLFVNAAALEKQTGSTDMDRLGGIASRMPVTGTTSVLAMLSTSGLPPLSGFWSKLIIVVAVWKSGEPGFAALAVLASLLTLAYFLSMQRRVFFGPLAATCAELREVGPWGWVPAVLLAALTLGLGLGAPWLFHSFILPVGSIL